MSSCSFKTPSTTPTTNHFTESEAHSSLTQATDWSEFYHSSPATQLLSKNFTDARKLPNIPTRMPSCNAEWEAESPASGLRTDISQKTKSATTSLMLSGAILEQAGIVLSLLRRRQKPSTVCRLSRWSSGRAFGEDGSSLMDLSGPRQLLKVVFLLPFHPAILKRNARSEMYTIRTKYWRRKDLCYSDFNR